LIFWQVSQQHLVIVKTKFIRIVVVLVEFC